MNQRPCFVIALAVIFSTILIVTARVSVNPVDRQSNARTAKKELPAIHRLKRADSSPIVADLSPQRRSRNRPVQGVYKAKISPHWFANNTRFWYRNDLRGGTKEFILVDAEKGIRQHAFDHDKLAGSLTMATGQEYLAAQLPFDEIRFTESGTAVRFTVQETPWSCDLKTYKCSKLDGANAQTTEPTDNFAGGLNVQQSRGGLPKTGRSQGGPSPDANWTAFVRDGNVFVSARSDDREIQLSTDGTPEISYGLLEWSPDSRTLVAFRIEPGDNKEVYLIESSPDGGGRAVLHRRPYALPGDRFTSYELNLFSMEDHTRLRPGVEKIELGFGRPRLRWNGDGSHLRYRMVDRGHQRFRVIDVDAHTGESFDIIDETTETFIWTAHKENIDLRLVNWLQHSDEIIYASERDGWRHLYLVDAKHGGIKNQITQGQYVVRGIDRIDEQNRQIWFHASGKNPDQDPYFIHYYRVDFEGTNLVALTQGNGNHTVQYSPDGGYLIDTFSRVDQAPIHQLRRASDGVHVCHLEESDISELQESGWKPLEVFVAKGRDGTTDIWGVICRPRDFDPSKKYPIIESIYAGPHGSFVPKSFRGPNRYSSLADLGFIVVQIDGMGTANRSKAFHDVCWHNLKDAGLPDRILWIKAAAQKYPYMDTSRVGIYGNSAGGQSSTAALLFHPEFYKVAVSSCGCHDNRMDKASWNEQWMGYPVDKQYSENSNIDNAHRLQGKLLLIVGEMDRNVPPESTMRLADALIKADKDFQLLVIPGGGHGMGGAYGSRRMREFFVRHLQNVEPSNHNTSGARDSPVASLATSPPPPTVSHPPESFFEKVRQRDREVARSFYKKFIDIHGLPVVASAEVADVALQRTYDIVDHMLAGRPDIRQAMIDRDIYLIIIGKDQLYTDMPEYRNRRNKAYLNERVRGTGGNPTSFGEENLLSLPIDRYDDESIAVHEFCHTIDRSLRSFDPRWRERRDTAYRNAMGKGLYKLSYAASNPGEYWAEIAQAYFDCQRVNNWNHGPIGTREQLKAYDPEGYELCRTTFNLSPNQDWRYSWIQSLPNVAQPPAKFNLDPYYTKFTWAREFTVIGRSASDEALLRANDTIRKMFAYRHDLLKALIADGVKLIVLGPSESLADLPELASLKDNNDVDLLARTLDYRPDTKLLVVGEENVMGDPNDPNVGCNQIIRTMANAIHQVTATRAVDPNWKNRGRAVQQYELRVQRLDIRFDEKLKKLYEQAMSSGKWQGTMAVHDHVEYWTAGVLAYFDALGQDAAPNDAPHSIKSREALQGYDPELFALVHETIAYEGRVDWRLRMSSESTVSK